MKPHRPTMPEPFVHHIVTPWGVLAASWSAGHLLALQWCDEAPPRLLPAQSDAQLSLEQALEQYALAPKQPSIMAKVCPLLEWTQGTPFQQRVWRALLTLSDGSPPTPTTYQALANQLHHPRAVRAVARAVSQNPWMVVVPCHRVIGSDGALRGYRGGLPRKQALLSHEASF